MNNKKNLRKWVIPFFYLTFELITFFINRTDLLLVGIIFFNIIAFVTFGIDKKKAIKGNWRIPEALFFLWSFLGAAIGILIGMKFFHHKTKHLSFKIYIPLLSLWNIVWFYLLLMGLNR